MRTGKLAALTCVLIGLTVQLVKAQVPQPPTGKFVSPVIKPSTPNRPSPAANPAASSAAQAIAPAPTLHSARAALQTFLRTTAERDLAAAVRCLDFSGVQFDTALGSEPTFLEREKCATQLRAALDRLEPIDLTRVSDDPLAQPVQLSADVKLLSIMLARGRGGAWRFTAETINMLRTLPPPPVQAAKPAFFKWTVEELQDLWHSKVPFIETEASRIVWCAIILLLALAFGRLLRMSLGRAARKLEDRGKELAAVTLGALSRSVYLVVFTKALAMAVQVLELRPALEKGALAVVDSLMAATIGYIVWRLVDVVTFWLSRLSTRTHSRLDDMLIPLVSKCLRVAIVLLVLAQVANALSGQTVTSVLAGLGIGGLAIGLAAQDTIKNLFGSVMIFGDRPFEMGDRIVVDGHDGPVEMVGFRSTRIRTSEGYLVTIPNGELANKTILNMGKPPSLKRSLTIKLASETAPEKVEQAVQILKALLQDHEGMPPKRPPSVLFTEITDQSLQIAVTYHFTPPDANRFAALNERVNFEILRRLKQAEIQLATASQTLHLAAEARPRLAVTPEELKEAMHPPAIARSALSMHEIKPRRIGA